MVFNSDIFEHISRSEETSINQFYVHHAKESSATDGQILACQNASDKRYRSALSRACHTQPRNLTFALRQVETENEMNQWPAVPPGKVQETFSAS